MKFVKLGIFTLALGMFIASCGSNETTETPEEAPMEEVAPEVEEAPVMEEVAPVDTTVAPEAAPATEEAAH